MDTNTNPALSAVVELELTEGDVVVDAEGWAAICDAVAVLRGRLALHVDPVLLLRLDAVTKVEIERADDAHVEPAETHCGHDACHQRRTCAYL